MSATTGTRATALAHSFGEAVDRFVAMVEGIDERQWSVVSDPRVWSIGKEVEHVADAVLYHLWFVRLTIGERVLSRRPVLERKRMTTALTPRTAVEALAERRDEGMRLIGGLSDEQLDRPTRPPRANGQVLADSIALVLIDHVGIHGTDIAAKVRPGRGGSE